ncbi:hypothetical protein A3K69_06920 [Candidatus Bathyarchaeota archaeon RBG_16_57_9]|nr:MAG: hypothetical protein A3K69_06920 [Candidatus Bathyarchaeota archaeon RBG_16_57_9]OGD54455.1 MAG: hypothetical protein A3K81_06270 [Candidatus Bathyarchaeota archaeon RBG_13_60_20]
MDEREIYFTRHALERMVLRDISPDDVVRAMREGERAAEGKDKARYVQTGRRRPSSSSAASTRTS